MPTKTLSPARVAAEIKRRNRVFSAASSAQKRVLLAQDAIDQVKAKLFKPRSGVWACMDIETLSKRQRNAITHEEMEEIDKTSLQTAMLDGTIPTCECCALGGLLTSCVLFKNKATYGDTVGEIDIDDNHAPNELLAELFSPQQLALIETAFEVGDGALEEELNSRDRDRAIDFGERYDTVSSLFIAIMRNIVKNGGTFVP